MKTGQLLVLLAVIILFVGCSTPPYARNRSRTAAFGDVAFRYGSIGLAGAGGYLAGDALGGGDPMIGGAAAAAGAGLTYALHKVYDKKQMAAYNTGVEAGRELGRAELLRDQWTREAVYGLTPEGEERSYGRTVRNIFVPSRNVNNVHYNSGYQQVFIR